MTVEIYRSRSSLDLGLNKADVTYNRFAKETKVWSSNFYIYVPDKVLYEEMMTKDYDLESNLLISSLLKIRSMYKFCRVTSCTC